MEMNDNLQNEYVSSGMFLLNRHTPPQFNESSKLSKMNWGVKNYDAIGDHFLYE